MTTIYAVMETHYGDNAQHVVELFKHNITAEVLLRELREECFKQEMECNSVGCTSYYIREFDVNTELLGV